MVLLAGDEEYRSEEALPMLAKILSTRHGFDTTLLFSHAEDGTIDPKAGGTLGGAEALDSADALVMSLRFRHWNDETMERFVATVNRGVPMVALRTSTHLFNFPANSRWRNYSWNGPEGGFGKRILGETWISHWGKHKAEATLGVIEPGQEGHAILSGVHEVVGDSDVYEVYPPEDATILMRGLVLAGMEKGTPPAEHEKTRRSDGQTQKVNDPPMPIAWTREVPNEAGGTNKVMTMTAGAATDLLSEDLRRMVVNGVFWGLGIEVPLRAEVDFVGEFVASPYAFDGFKKGMKAEDFLN